MAGTHSFGAQIIDAAHPLAVEVQNTISVDDAGGALSIDIGGVAPGLDATDALQVSLYGKGTVAGDTPAEVIPHIGGSYDYTGHNLLLTQSVLLAWSGAGNRFRTIMSELLTNDALQSSSTAALYTIAVPGLQNPSGTLDKGRGIAAAGAGLGVARVGTLGETITPFASAARTVGSANGTAIAGLGWRKRYMVVLDVTAVATEVGDTLDVYLDVSYDGGTTYVNAIHFTQVLGDGGVKRYYAVLDTTAPGTSVLDATADAAAGASRSTIFGDAMRGRYTIADAGTQNASFTFSLKAYAQ